MYVIYSKVGGSRVKLRNLGSVFGQGWSFSPVRAPAQPIYPDHLGANPLKIADLQFLSWSPATREVGLAKPFPGPLELYTRQTR